MSVPSFAGETAGRNSVIQHLSSKAAPNLIRGDALKLKTNARLMEVSINAQAEVDVAFSINVSVS